MTARLIYMTAENKDEARRIAEAIGTTGTGGARPSWFGSTTPRIRWADGTDQGESIDILKALDERYPSSTPLFDEHSAALIGAFKDIFPRTAQCPNERRGDRVHKHALALSYAQG